MKVNLLLMLCALLLVAGPVAAESDDKPFAEAFILLQISDADPDVQARVINVASNLVKHYGGPDFVAIEVVAFGPGLSLLFPGNPQEERIRSLVASDVRFVGCLNTLASIELATGKLPDILPEASMVQTGVAHIVERAGQGYVVIRP
jgi:intracellular sulfur oxidation DsrE/DsrF family protein